MAKTLGALLAFLSIAVCILAGIDPVTTTVRGLSAFAIGIAIGAVWDSIMPAKRQANIYFVDEQAEVGSGNDSAKAA